MKTNRVRFAANCQVIVVVDRTKGVKDDLWYSGDDVDHFKLYSTLYADEVKKSSLCNSKFCGAIDDILGLEKLIFKQSYYDRRRLLMSAVLEEQAWQKLCKELWRRRGLSGDVDRNFENTCIMRLDSIAEKNSRWAKEWASLSARALQRHVAKERSNKSRASIVDPRHTQCRQDQDKVRPQTQYR
jgi:hypothetical protein